MSWKKWKRGLLIAILTGAGTGVVGLAVGITWEQASVILLACIGKDLCLYLKSHPIEAIADTTTFIKRASTISSSGSAESPTGLQQPSVARDASPRVG